MKYISMSFLLALGTCALGQDLPSVWDRPIAPQPYENQPFHEVRIPSWVEELTGAGYTLSVMDAASREKAAKHGVGISEMGFVNPFFACYDSRFIKKRSPDYPDGRIEQEIREYKRLGVRILAVYPPTLQGEVYEKHPEWRRIATDTREIPAVELKQSPHGGMLCLLGPYGDFFIEVLAEILEKFPNVDAFSFDGLHHGGVCYCGSCRDGFRAETGREIPKVDLDDPAFRRYQHWADRGLESLVRKMQSRLKSIKRDVALITWTTNAGRFGHFLSLPRNMPSRMNLLLDAPDQEFWLDETNRGTTIVPAIANAYIWATTNHRVAFSEPYILSHGNPYGKDSFPPHEIERRMLLALSYGAQPSIAVLQPPRLQESLYACMDQVARRKPWLTHKKPEPWAALLMSDNTRTFYGRDPGKVEERYLANVLGAFRAMVEEHVPSAVINDWNLTPTDLAPYRVLVLPNAACLDRTQVAAIDRFVSEGGGLVASLDTSLFDEFGDPREQFALSEVFGVEYRGPAGVEPPQGPGREIDVNFARAIGPEYWEKRKSIYHFHQDVDSFLNEGLMKTYVGPEPVTFKGPAVRVSIVDTQARTVGSLTPHAGADKIPGVVSRKHGKGRVVYLAAGLDAGYYLYPFPYERLALARSIRWAAGDEPPPVRVEAPMCVHASLMRQSKEGSVRLILHLYSDLNTSAHHALPADDVPLREESVSIHDISVTFHPRYRISRVHLEPEGRDLTRETIPAGTRVVVPRLDIHTMVVAELEAESRGDPMK